MTPDIIDLRGSNQVSGWNRGLSTAIVVIAAVRALALLIAAGPRVLEIVAEHLDSSIDNLGEAI
jgi:hypothetical protein